jgi:hypothetical protein
MFQSCPGVSTFLCRWVRQDGGTGFSLCTGFSLRQPRLAAVLSADQVVHDRARLRAQFLFAEVFDFVSGDELGVFFLLLLRAATTAALIGDHNALSSSHPFPSVPHPAQELRELGVSAAELSCKSPTREGGDAKTAFWRRAGQPTRPGSAPSRSLVPARTGHHTATLQIKGENALSGPKSVQICHLSAHNLTPRESPQTTDIDKDLSFFPLQRAPSFVRFPSFYMQPDKTPPNLHEM